MSEESEPNQSSSPNYALHLLLFLATCTTTTWVGILQTHPEVGLLGFRQMLPFIKDGLPYSMSLMGILTAHEMGHYLLARWHGVRASLPYFLPVPLPLVGTMGAVIVMKGGIPSRNGLVDWAAAGPLAGLCIAIPVLVHGIHTSTVGPMAHVGILEGNSILYLLLKLFIKGAILPGNGQDIQLNPVAWAGWLGILVTMINLMPIGQLDGGHIAYAFFGQRHNKTSVWLHRGLLVLALLVMLYVAWDLSSKLTPALALSKGFEACFPWLLWWGLLKLMKRLSRGQFHPPVAEEEPLTPMRRRLCKLMLVVFVLIFTPIPLRTIV